ncbi:TPA: hypothetical protein ACQUHF_004393 [Bacillus paranthracis]|uniref:hypothetical protein n=1 Tax=Bacillus cereus group TaxID=86661 RepID=UPI0022DEBBD6|nr:hypothetical protein [Bacillus cereus group sp. TH40LC]MDA1514557.1 hypothetical protein [Bacillus cereus group sp. TH40LC]
MTILHDYEQMPPLYRFIYYKVRFDNGKDLHKFVSKMIKDVEKKKVRTLFREMLDDELVFYIENGITKTELQLIQSLLSYKYNTEDIHPKYLEFHQYVSKTKSSTTVETRKMIREVIFGTQFIYALSREEITGIKKLFKGINLEEIMKEVSSLAEKEQERINTYQKEASKRKRIGSAINRALSEIGPIIKEEASKKKNFFTKLKFNKKKIGFFITPNIGKDREIVTSYLNKASRSERIILELDNENENYFISFSEPLDLAFMRSILSQRFLKEPLEGFKILGIPIQVIIVHCKYKEVSICESEWHELDFNVYYESIKNGIFAFNNRLQIKSYSEESIRFVIHQLMKETKFESELYLACYLHYNFLLPMQNYVNKREEFFEKNNVFLMVGEFKKKREEIYQQLVLSGDVKVKWKNETELFKLVVKQYPDAIFQYRADWLDKQSLDVYIPGLKTAIEFQGQQHYEPVEFFGGEDAFLYRQKLDALKKEKCKQNKVKLIEWHYQDVISKTNLNRKINQ